MAEEMADIVDEADAVIGTATRSEVRARKLLHRGIVVLVRNSSGEVYVHRRTGTKDVFPGMYSMFVAGMVSAGDDYDDTARRELTEELGITGAPLRFISKHVLTGPENPHWVQAYEVIWDGPIRHQTSEIAWGTFMTIETLEQRIAEWPFTPNALELWRLLFSDR